MIDLRLPLVGFDSPINFLYKTSKSNFLLACRLTLRIILSDTSMGATSICGFIYCLLIDFTGFEIFFDSIFLPY